MKKKENLSFILVILLIILFPYLGDFGREIILFFDVNGWERVSKITTRSFVSFIEYDSENEILWMSDDGNEFYKVDLYSPDQSQEITLESITIQNVCVTNDDIIVVGLGNPYLIDKNNLEVEEVPKYNGDTPFGCLIYSQDILLVYDHDWYGIYKQQSWQFFEEINWEGERLGIQTILGPYNGSLFLITNDNRLFSLSSSLDEIHYIREMPFRTEDLIFGGISFDEIFWLSTFDGNLYIWSLPFDDQNLTPQVFFCSEKNKIKDVFVDKNGRIWMICEKEILIAVGQDDFASIKMPYRVDRINSVYIDEDSNQIFIGTEVGIFRSSIEELLEVNGLNN